MTEIPWKDDTTIPGTVRTQRAVIGALELIVMEMPETPLSGRTFFWAICRLPNYICLRADVSTSFESAKQTAADTFARIRATEA